MENSKVYIPLQASYHTKDTRMEIDRFRNVEAVLHLAVRYSHECRAEYANLILAKYTEIGATGNSPKDYIIQQAMRGPLAVYRSSTRWQEDLDEYGKDLYNGLRAFEFYYRPCSTKKQDLLVKKMEDPYGMSYAERLEEWEKLWEAKPQKPEKTKYAGGGMYRFPVIIHNPRELSWRDVFLPAQAESIEPPPFIFNHPVPEKKERLCIPVSELLTCAEEMKKINPEDHCCENLSEITLRISKDQMLFKTDILRVQGVTNVVGRVGAGKTTLARVLAYWCIKHQRRICIAVEACATALELARYFQKFGINCSPLIGGADREKYLTECYEKGQSVIDPYYSKVLTCACIIDGGDFDHEQSFCYGEEPCGRLSPEGERTVKESKTAKRQDSGPQKGVCPYYNVCPRTKMRRDAFSTGVLVTTYAGLASSTVGYGKTSLLELVLHDFDCVVFDEADKGQQFLDGFFMPDMSFDRDFIKENAVYLNRAAQQPPVDRETSPNYMEVVTSINAMPMLKNFNELMEEAKGWSSIKSRLFSSFTLIRDLREAKPPFCISEELEKRLMEIIRFRDLDNSDPLVLLVKQASGGTGMSAEIFDYQFEQYYKSPDCLFPKMNDEDDQRIMNNRLKLLLHLIHLENFISHNQVEGMTSLNSRIFARQQLILPAAAPGYLFGLRSTTDNDLVVYRQYAYGRSLVQDLPYLLRNAAGIPCGPAVLLLSGTSFVPGCHLNHLNRPVSYILESDKAKTHFLEKTRFFAPYSEYRVSGAGSKDNMIVILKKLTTESVERYVKPELDRKLGKALLIVNSYDQAKACAGVVAKELGRSSDKYVVVYLAQAGKTDQEAPADCLAVHRNDLENIYKTKADVLVAPASAIGRGFNMLDRDNNSYFGSIYFMTRILTPPEDLKRIGSTVNGIMAEHKIDGFGTELEYNIHFRSLANRLLTSMAAVHAYSMSELSQTEIVDIVSSMFVTIFQLYGRLVRVKDPYHAPGPHVYFLDGAFRRKSLDPNAKEFDCLKSMMDYMDSLQETPAYSAIFDSLYGPFYRRMRKELGL